MLTDEGPGALSVGSSEGFGSLIAFASVAAGVAGGFAAMELGAASTQSSMAGAGRTRPGQRRVRAQPAAASASA